MKIKYKPEEQYPALRFWIDKKNLLVQQKSQLLKQKEDLARFQLKKEELSKAGFRVDALDRIDKPVSSRVRIDKKNLEQQSVKKAVQHRQFCIRQKLNDDDSRPPSRFHQSTSGQSSSSIKSKEIL